MRLTREKLIAAWRIREYHLQPLLDEYLGNRIDDLEIQNCLLDIKDEFTSPL